MKNNLFKNLYKIAIFILLLFVMDYVGGNLCRKYYFMQTKGPIFKTNYSIDSVKTDILIFGSSRASHHYISSIFEDSLSMSCFNAGMDGQFILFHYAILQCIVDRYTPKLIILDFTPTDLLVSDGTYDRLNVLLPYYKTHKEVVPILNLRRFEKLKLLSQIYPFNHCLFDFMKVNPMDMTPSLKLKGYIPETSVWNEKRINESIFDFKYDPNKLEAYQKIMDICNSKDIKLIVIVSPLYLDLLSQSNRLYSDVSSFAKERNIPFYNFSQDTTFINHAELFHDQIHLNNTGAKIYSKYVVAKIKELNLISNKHMVSNF